MEFTRLEDEFAVKWDAEGTGMRKKLRQTPTAFFILRGK